MLPMIVRAEVRMAWWLRWWLRGIATVAMLSGCTPDPERVASMVRRGVKVMLKP